MVKITVNVKGLSAALRQAPATVAEKVDKALEKNATELVGAAKALAESSRQTGALIASIASEKVSGGYAVEAKDEAAGPVEWGTRKQEAEPFLYPAYRLNKKRSRGRVRRAIKAAIKEAGLGK
ncbi:HK97-gp10 family putative phage morphogenesis protein [Shinella zoogloeoides]|uniref:HK97-gp10 family putative phage morphogenesis protein n=1 Tax=Shinella zoogloeoides TaxID=352475 RepID=UPI001F580E81|nr:HK97-gp10 family putative phage morphogenesis protein [Shinella zoogloeoides]